MQTSESINLGVSFRPEDDLCRCVSPTMRKTGCHQSQEAAAASFLLVFKWLERLGRAEAAWSVATRAVTGSVGSDVAWCLMPWCSLLFSVHSPGCPDGLSLVILSKRSVWLSTSKVYKYIIWVIVHRWKDVYIYFPTSVLGRLQVLAGRGLLYCSHSEGAGAGVGARPEAEENAEQRR